MKRCEPCTRECDPNYWDDTRVGCQCDDRECINHESDEETRERVERDWEE